jgi:hypothetical protein
MNSQVRECVVVVMLVHWAGRVFMIIDASP